VPRMANLTIFCTKRSGLLASNIATGRLAATRQQHTVNRDPHDLREHGEIRTSVELSQKPLPSA
jgi:hypothetical protein